VKVELVEGGGEPLWPRPGRLFAVSTKHDFGQFAAAIDNAFARWDLSHLHEFELPDGTRIGISDPDDDAVLDERRLNLSRLRPADQFIYVFDLGDDWAHLCTVGDSPIDPLERVGLVPDGPLPYFGWGAIPDQYGRGWSDDDGESPLPADPQLSDLPPLRPDWGPGRLP
jgi:Plasmid pRiA4b ORF-3-like protein